MAEESATSELVELTRRALKTRSRPSLPACVLSGEVHPALVQALLAAPGDLHDTRILPQLACL